MVWEAGFKDINPLDLPPVVLDKMRQRAAVLFPHGIMANSPTQPLQDRTEGKFGPFAGQLLVGDMDHEYIMRVMLEEVDGEMQGACVTLFDSLGLRIGNNRLAFAPDGSLWVGQSDHGWRGDEGIQKIAYTGKTPTDVLNMSLTEKGFDLTFTKSMQENTLLNAKSYKMKRYYYNYHRKYGSPQMDIQEVAVTSVDFNAQSNKLSLAVDTLKAGYVYELEITDIKANDGSELDNNILYYTANRLRK